MYDLYIKKKLHILRYVTIWGVTLNVLFCALLFSFKIPYEHLTTLL